MAEKAVVTGVSYLIKQANGTYELTVTAQVTNGNAHVGITVIASSPSFTPLTPTWRTRVHDAVIDGAQSQLSIDIDGVMFPDFGVLGL